MKVIESFKVKVNGVTINLMGEEYSPGLMDPDMKETGLTIKELETGSISIQMETNTKGNSRMENLMEREPSHG